MSVWGTALRCLWRRVVHDNLDILAGGVALFAILAFLPAIAATVAIYGVVADPADIHAQVTPFAGVIPDDVMAVVTAQMSRAAQADDGALGWAFALSLAIAMFSALGGARGLIQALNLVNRRNDSRSYLRQTGLAFVLSLGGIMAVIIAVSLVVVLPTVLHFVRLDADTELLVTFGRWPALTVLVAAGLAVFYRLAPDQNTSRIWPGAILATLLWILGSVLLSLYVSHVANYSAYGAFGGVLVVVLWFYVSAFVVLLGAALNRELAVASSRSVAGAQADHQAGALARRMGDLQADQRRGVPVVAADLVDAEAEAVARDHAIEREAPEPAVERAPLVDENGGIEIR
jgi:membrane protein